MAQESELGKWIVSAGLLVLGVMLIIAGLSLGFERTPFYFGLSIVGAYLDYVVVYNQVISNLRLGRRARTSQ